MLARELVSHSVEDTLRIGREFGAGLGPGDVVALVGDLGAGKTHFVKGVAAAQGVDPADVSSPTFTIAHLYRGRLPIHHLDCYRLEDERELMRTGAHEVFGEEGIVLIEWPQRIEALLPEHTILVDIRHEGPNERRIRILEADDHA
ncbi:MAG: tRNA (adenosine(37)-N6)-threonylcarbamoyltransferase complex ATPase subunit type 1 TsaE [Bacteroidetes bacterium]|nr:tRNA (adenosine(37)-N6)-threonylcarbamoyltransferase complex ATPase subunit type 1 TsaE [Bacteroidota bacterium]MDA0874802.1 tRNA (adenosine(37)-N6)-threonylcarbamoyltransferase complex ATPase subunit type 1 TsaE [Bacteroidota bacterium]